MKKKDNKIPLMALLIIKIITLGDEKFSMIKEFNDEFEDIAHSEGIKKARVWYWKHLIISMPLILKESFYWRMAMIKNYLKIAYRSIIKNKGFSIINILGLAIGMAVCLLFSLWAFDEFNYNKFHVNYDRLYRVTELSFSGNTPHVLTNTVAPLGPVLKEEFPEIADYTRFQYLRSTMIRYEDKKLYENAVIAANNSLFKMFSFSLVRGDKNTVLVNPNSIVIDETTAEKYFGDSDPIGKVIQVNNQYDFIVEGVFEDIGSNTDIQFSIVLAWDHLEGIYPRVQWDNHVISNYVLLADNATEQDTERKIINVINDHGVSTRYDVFLQPLSDVHLRSNFGSRISSETYVYIILIIAVFVLLLACINFMNLSTARSSYRFKEIGMRKVVGGRRVDIIVQFFSESLLFSFISFIIALLLLFLILPSFNTFTEKQLILSVKNDWLLIAGMLAVTFITGVIAGSYPAIYLSAFKPLNVLKGINQSGGKSTLFRRILVVFQFAGSIILITGTMIIYSQLDYMMNADLGWDRDHLMSISLRGGTNKSYDLLKNELSNIPGINNVSGGRAKPPYGGYGTNYKIDWTGMDPDYKPSISYNDIDYGYIETVGLEIIKGRSFSKDFATDTLSAYVINESLADLMGADPVIGADFKVWDVPGKVIGVVKDYHFFSLRSEIGPIVLRCQYKNSWKYILIRINPENINSTTEYIKETWEKINPDFPMIYGFISDDFTGMYSDYTRMGKLMQYSAILAVFIACLGLFGLVSFSVEKKKKEIGLRKTLGASTPVILKHVTREFVMLVVISSSIAIPAAYYIFGQWLDNFAYRTEPGIGLFLLSGLSALLVALFSVSYQAIKAARANPVDSLRYE